MYMYTTLMEYFSDFLLISPLSFRFVSDINSQINVRGALWWRDCYIQLIIY